MTVSPVASDPEIQADVQFPQAGQGAALVVRTGGQINLESGAKVFSNGVDVTPNGPVVGGSVALSGTNPTTIATGLATVTGFAATISESAAPGDNTTTLTWTATGGTVSVYAWKPTSVSNPTLIASTGTETIGWIAIGTR